MINQVTTLHEERNREAKKTASTEPVKKALQTKVGVVRNELFIGFNKQTNSYHISTVAATKELVWDNIYYRIEGTNVQVKREMAKRALGDRWEVVGFQGIFPLKGTFTS